MAQIPLTSVSLIRTLADDPQSVRWGELYRLYEAPMRAFLQQRFPSLEADDLIQETMVALAKRLPDYRYTPDEKGHFRNYLMGILKHKAMDQLARRTREAAVRADLQNQPAARALDDDGWKADAVEVAIAQLLADESVNPLHRTVFRHVGLMHEKPEDVAAAFGLTRSNVDQIKKRMIARLSTLVEALLARDEP